MTTFLEILFPSTISYGSSGGPKFKTTIFIADSGYEQRNVDWASQRAEYNVSHGIKNLTQMEELKNFFYGVRGRAFGFRFKDWNDYSLANQTIGFGDGATQSFQIVKTYKYLQTESAQTQSYTRKITKINWNTVAGVSVGGVIVTQTPDLETGQAWSVDHAKGLITFVVPPDNLAEIKIGVAEFHVPVRFDTDHLDVSHEFWLSTTWPNIPLLEVRDWGEVLA